MKKLSLWGHFVDCLQNHYCDFNGRARRREYWGYTLFIFIISLIYMLFATFALRNNVVLYYGGFVVLGLVFLLPGMSLLARRLHDTGKPTWAAVLLYVLALIPFVSIFSGIVTLVFACLDGVPGPNEYGEDPKGRNSDQFPPIPPRG